MKSKTKRKTELKNKIRAKKIDVKTILKKGRGLGYSFEGKGNTEYHNYLYGDKIYDIKIPPKNKPVITKIRSKKMVMAKGRKQKAYYEEKLLRKRILGK